MKTIFALLLLGLFGAAVTPVHAKADRSDLIANVESCEAILREFMAVPATAIPPAVLKQAHAILIVNQFKAGFILGIEGGYGVLLAKKPNGKWSLPVLVQANEASFGLQAGANAVESVYIFTDEATPRLMFNQRFHIGVDARAVAGPHVADAEANTRPLLAAPVLAYTKTNGLFAGAAVKAAQIKRDDKANFLLYQTSNTMPELLYSDWVTPPAEVLPLMNYVQQIAP